MGASVDIRHFFIRSIGVVLVLFMSACGAGSDGTERGFELRLSTSDEATPSDAGLPAYPGAKPYKDEKGEAGANIGFASPVFGLKVVAMNLQTTDKPEKVAQFYHRALSQYGHVLECSDRATRGSEREDLTCDDDDPEHYRVVYKVGSKEDQRIVAVKPHGTGSRFSLVRVAVRTD